MPAETQAVRAPFGAKAIGALLVSIALLIGSTAGVAASGHHGNQQDGLVNVMVGDVTILEDVRVALAARVVAQICGVKVGPVAVLGRAVDRSGDAQTVCEVNNGPVRIVQN